MSAGTDNLSPNLPQRRNLLFRQGGVEGVGKKKSIAVEGSAAGTEGAQRGGLGGEGMAGAPLGAGTGGIALVAVTDTVSTKNSLATLTIIISVLIKVCRISSV